MEEHQSPAEQPAEQPAAVPPPPPPAPMTSSAVPPTVPAMQGGAPEPVLPQEDPAQLLAAIQSGGNWFYWIAGLSLINSIISHSKGDVQFVIGLGFTQLVDGLMHEFNPGATGIMIALVIDVVAAGFYGMLGYYAVRRQAWAFTTGIVLYLLDALLCLLAQDYWSLGFHAFALLGIFKGAGAVKKLAAVEAYLARLPRPAPAEEPASVE